VSRKRYDRARATRNIQLALTVVALVVIASVVAPWRQEIGTAVYESFVKAVELDAPAGFPAKVSMLCIVGLGSAFGTACGIAGAIMALADRIERSITPKPQWRS